jgi:hypothetical protein
MSKIRERMRKQEFKDARDEETLKLICSDSTHLA